MEKIISMKFAVVIFLVVTSVMSIEATRLLTEEALETVLHGESLPHGEEKFHFDPSEETLETVLLGESWLHSVKLRDSN
ncbi:unnamed protein product [Brassica oleracea]